MIESVPLSSLAPMYAAYCVEHFYFIVESDLRDHEFLAQWAADQSEDWLTARYMDDALTLDEYEQLLARKYGLS